VSSPSEESEGRGGELGFAPAARPAQLSLKVVRKPGQEHVFDCWVSSPLVEQLAEPQVGEWELPPEVGQIVTEFMKEFENRNNSGADRLMSLEGAGQELWEVVPPGLSQALELLAQEGQEVTSIQIVSDENSVPWELMIPDDGESRPLGVRYALARWFTGDEPLREAGRPAANARVGMSSDGQPKLAEDEATLICDLLTGERLKATTAAAIRMELEPWDGTVLHFVCHGSADRLFLNKTTALTARQVAAMRDRLRPGWRQRAPVVFLNACKAGKAVPSLIGPGGLSRSWARVGAGAVIAPLWSVHDKVAHAVAEHFYERITKEPLTPYAEIVRDIRAMAQDREEVSYAAYCYFGSPWACAGDATIEA